MATDDTEIQRPHMWAERTLGIELLSDSHTILRLDDLAGVAVRRNPKRTQLLVSTVLGRHYPSSPTALRAAGQLLAHRTAEALRLQDPSPVTRPLESALAAALRDPDDPGARRTLHAVSDHLLNPPAPTEAPLVVAFAEAATGLGHAVSAALPGSVYIHSTHSDPDGFSGRRLEFREPHSHAAEHLILPAPGVPLDDDRPLVLVDDEVSTGTTIINTILAFQKIHARTQYTVASLVDLRSDEDRARTEEFAREQGIELHVVALATGSVKLPATARTVGDEFVAVSPGPALRPWVFDHQSPVLHADWPVGVPAEALHGIRHDQTDALRATSGQVAELAASQLSGPLGRLLVLGVEEFQYVPGLVASELESMLTSTQVNFGAVTRSPVVALNRPGYPIRSAISVTGMFDAHDRRFLYNVVGPHIYDAIVLLLPPSVDPDAVTAPDGALQTLAGVTPRLVAIQV